MNDFYRERQRIIEAEQDIPGAARWLAGMIPHWLLGGPVRVSLGRPRRTLDQNAKFHAICSDVAKQAEYMGRRLSKTQWKVLFVSGHAIITGQGSDMIPGIEGEFVNLRESTAAMTKERLSSLIEYTLAWCAENEIDLKEAA